MGTTSSTPQRLTMESLEREDWLLVSKPKQGSEVHFGYYWTYPGEESAFSFQAASDRQEPGVVPWPPIHDVYLVIRGRLRVSWSTSDVEESFELGPFEVGYFPPGYSYGIKCVSLEPALVVYAAAPAPDEHPSSVDAARGRVELMARRLAEKSASPRTAEGARSGSDRT